MHITLIRRNLKLLIFDSKIMQLSRYYKEEIHLPVTPNLG